MSERFNEIEQERATEVYRKLKRIKDSPKNNPIRNFQETVLDCIDLLIFLFEDLIILDES